MMKASIDHRPGLCGLAAIILAAVFGAGCQKAPNHAESEDPAQAELEIGRNQGLEWVPADARVMISLRLANLVKEGGGSLTQWFGEGDGTFLLEKQTGLTPKDIDRCTYFISRSGQEDSAWIVSTSKPCEPAKIVNLVNAHTASATFQSVAETVSGKKKEIVTEEKKLDGKRYFTRDDGKSGVLFLDEHTFLIGPEHVAKAVLAQPSTPAGKLSLPPQAFEAAGKFHVTVAVDVQTVAKEWKQASVKDPFLAPYMSLASARTACLGVNLGKQFQADLRLDFNDEVSAMEGEKAGQNLAKMVRAHLLDWIGKNVATASFHDPKMKEWASKIVQTTTLFGKEAEKTLEDPDIQRDHKSLKVSLNLPVLDSSFAVMGLSLGVIESFNRAFQPVTFKKVGTKISKSQTIEVLVAKKDLTMGLTIVEPDKLFIKKEITIADAPPGGFVLDLKDVKDRELSKSVLKDSPLAKNDLVSEVITPTIPEGYRAMAIKVKRELLAAGFVVPGSKVDVLWTEEKDQGKPEERVLLQNLLVIAIDLAEEKESGNRCISPVVVLAVTPEWAQKLKLAAALGELRVVLRSLDD